MSVLSLRERILNVLAATERPHLTGALVAARAGLGTHDTYRVLAALAKANRVSRRKSNGSSYYLYWVTDEQAARHLHEKAPGKHVMAADPASIPGKIRYLKDILSRPAFEGHAVLEAIIADYTLTLKAVLASSEERNNRKTRERTTRAYA